MTAAAILLVALLFARHEPAFGVFQGHVKDGARPLPSTSRLASSWLSGFAHADQTVVHGDRHRPLPRHFDWRDVDGVNYCTSDVNQHVPTYCGSCWVHGSVAQLNDRVKIARKAAWPDVMISRQAVVNCATNSSGVAPGCLGGEPYMVFGLMQNTPMPDEGCQPYMARNGECAPLCTNCEASGTCFALKAFTGFGVRSFGRVNGSEAMAKEIFENGPITCSFAATDEFVYNYSINAAAHGGVFTDDFEYPEEAVDHDVEVAGWDVTEDGVEYWIARNSWGTYWGENGWFRLKKGNLRMEEDCWWAIPQFVNLEQYLDGKYLGSYTRGLEKQELRRDQRPAECHRHGPWDSIVR